MSKCIKCGRELTSAGIPEFYNGMCEKCYKEQNCAEYPFKQGIYDYQKQIDQLKQQLEESFTEEDVNGLIEDRDKTIKFLQKELAKKEKELGKYKSYKTDDERIKDLIDLYSKYKEENNQLKLQLDEKQNEIDEINKEFVQAVHDWKVLCAEKDKEIEGLKTKQELTFMHSKEDYFQRCNLLEEANIKLQFTQTQLAIQELEKVNGILTDTIIEVTQDEFDLNKLCYLEEISAKFYEKIQQQINDLRGEKDIED